MNWKRSLALCRTSALLMCAEKDTLFVLNYTATSRCVRWSLLATLQPPYMTFYDVYPIVRRAPSACRYVITRQNSVSILNVAVRKNVIIFVRLVLFFRSSLSNRLPSLRISLCLLGKIPIETERNKVRVRILLKVLSNWSRQSNFVDCFKLWLKINLLSSEIIWFLNLEI